MEQDNIKIISGNSPVIVSAPHAAPFVKNGRVKKGEAEVEKIVQTLCRRRNTWGIHTAAGEPIENWWNGAYKTYKDMVELITEVYGVQLLVDIHGTKESRPFSVDYDFVSKKRYSKDRYIENMLQRNLEKHIPFYTISNGFFRSVNGKGKQTLTYHARRRLGIAAVQLEINKLWRTDRVQLEKVIRAIDSFILNYENTLTGVQQKEKVIRG